MTENNRIVDFERFKEDYLDQIDHKSFVIGLSAALAFYVLLILYAILTSASTVKHLESKLASQVIPIEHEKILFTENEKDIPGIPGMSLSKAPEPGLHEKTDTGLFLPIIRDSDGLTNFEQYKRPFKYAHVQKPIISIAVTDFGLSLMASQIALKTLPPEVSFILSPYSDQPQEWINAARDGGHELWLNIPIENKSASFSDPGPASLLARSNLATNRDALHWSLARGAGYAGIASFTDNSFYRAELLLDNLVSEFFKRGLGYLELNNAAPSTIQNIALRSNSPYVQSDLWIYSNEGNEQSFQKLEEIAKHKGYAMAVVPGFPANIGRLTRWLSTNQQNYLFVPASAFYDAPLQVANVLNNKDMHTDSISPHPLGDNDHYEPENNNKH